MDIAKLAETLLPSALVGVCGVGGEGEASADERKGDEGREREGDEGPTKRLTVGEGEGRVLGEERTGVDREKERVGPGPGREARAASAEEG